MHPIRKNRPATRRHPIVAWFGILALALPMFIPLAQGIPISSPTDGFKAPFYMVLCKAMQNGTGGKDRTPDEMPDFSDCPICIGFAFGKSVLSTSQASVTVPENRSFTLVFSTTEDARRGRLVSKSYARAPPISA